MADLFSAAYGQAFGTPQDNDMFATAKGLENLKLMQLLLQKQQQENERYRRLTPMELDIKGLEAARSREQSRPENVRQFSLGAFGKAQTEQAKGAEDMATLGGRVAKTNQVNETERFASENSNLVSALSRAITTGDRSGLPESYRSLPKETLMSLEDQLKTTLGDTPSHRAAVHLEQVKGEQQAAVAEIQGMDQKEIHAASDASRERIAAAHNTALKDIEQSRRSEVEKQQSFEQLAAFYIKKMNESATPEDKKAYREAAEDAYRRGLAYKEAAARARVQEEAAAFPLPSRQHGSAQPAQRPPITNPNSQSGWGGREIH